MSNAWDPQVIQSRLTRERLQSYLADCQDDLPRALDLYAWNMEVSGALLTVIGMVEVLVRNQMDAALTAWASNRPAPGTWFDAVPLDTRGRDDLAKARERARRDSRGPAPHGRVIAELTFGFWRYLAASRYLTTIWMPALHDAFPLGNSDLRQRRIEVDDALQRLHTVRNRAAHHEPIHRRNLLSDLTAADNLLGWSCENSRLWAQSQSTIVDIIARRPSSLES